MTSQTTHSIGDFEGRTLVGSFAPQTQDYDHQVARWGLPLECTYAYGTFRDAEDQIYSVVRRFATSGDTTGLILLRTRPGEAHMGVDGQVAANQFIGRARQEIDNRRARYTGGKNYPHGARSMQLEITPDTLTWHEGDAVEIAARVIGPGLQFYTPWRSGALLYTSRLWRATGNLNGIRVEGFLGLDQVYSPPGLGWGHEPVSEHLELSWYTWGNEYDDGTVEVGHIAAGRGHWGFSIMNASDGTVVRTTDSQPQVTERDEAGWPTRVTYLVDGEAWEWRTDERGRMPELGVPGERRTPNSEGSVRRVGENRKVTTWFGWGETAPANGDCWSAAPQLP